jgi:hypothetical protein
MSVRLPNLPRFSNHRSKIMTKIKRKRKSGDGQTITPLSEDWVQIANRWGSKIISMERLCEITPLPWDPRVRDKEHGQDLLTEAIDREIAEQN